MLSGILPSWQRPDLALIFPLPMQEDALVFFSCHRARCAPLSLGVQGCMAARGAQG